MSLRVWLPLRGDLINQGLDDITIINNSGASISNNGKLGKCYSFDGVDDWIQWPINKIDYGNKPLSLCCWFKSDKIKTDGCIIDIAADLCLRYSYNSNTVKFSYWRVYGTSSARQGDTQTTSMSFDADKWHNIIMIFDNITNMIYIDGVLQNTWQSKSQEYWVPLLGSSYNRLSIGKSAGSTSWIGGLVNDVRIYDHVLSPKEIEEISKGLVLHYKLDQNLNELNNCYSSPTFNTSSTNGGWSHWGQSGSSGTYGQNTDSQYIFDKTNTYSHWWANASTATGHYLLYQSPAFGGGSRSIQAILKEENSTPITEDIVYPAWNARSGGAPNHIWTSITPLGNGFYLCKCENVNQDGSNNLIGFYLTPGYKVYISEAYCENDREICSDIFSQNILTIIYDSSGYQNNGICNSIQVSNNSPRYTLSSIFNGTNSYIKVTDNNWFGQNLQEITINLWAKSAAWAGTRLFSCTESGGFNTEAGSSGYLRFPVYVCTNEAQTSYAYKYDSQELKISDLSTTDWNMITFVYNHEGTKTYINGELHHTYFNISYGIHFNTSARLFLGCEANGANAYQPWFNGQESDFRIYATALSAEQIKELYDTSMSIDSSGNIHAREVVEL